jgi:hypothetical protein
MLIDFYEFNIADEYVKKTSHCPNLGDLVPF